MKIFTMMNDAQRVILNNYFKPTLAAASRVADLTVIEAGQSDGLFLGVGYREIMAERLKLVLESLRVNDNQPVAWMDADLLFYGPPDPFAVALEELGDAPYAFQRECAHNLEINFGFMVARRCQASVSLIEMLLRDGGDFMLPDQDCLNQRIRDGFRVKTLSPKFLTNSFMMSVGWPLPPADTALFHGNCTFSVPQKLALLEAMRDRALAESSGT